MKGKKLLSKKILLALLVVLLLAGFLRVYKLGAQSLIADEFIGMNISYGFSQTGQWRFWDFNAEKLTDEEYTRGQVYYWQVAKIFDFIAPTEANSRLISVLWGLFGVLLIFFGTLWSTKNTKMSLLSALLLAVSVSALTFDRKLRMYSMFAPLFFLLSIFVFATIESAPKREGLIKKVFEKTGLNLFFLLATLLIGSLALKTHLLALNIFPILFIYLLVRVFLEYQKKRSFKNKYSFYLFAGVIFIPALLNLNSFQGALSFFQLFKFNFSYFEKILLDYSYSLIALPFLLFGSWWLVARRGKIGLWIVLSFLVPLLMAIFVWDRNAGLQYIHLIQLFKTMIFAVGIFGLAEYLGKNHSNKKLSALLIVIFFLISINVSFFFSSKSFYSNPNKWDHPNYRQSFDYLLRKKSEDEVVITRRQLSYYLWATDSKVKYYGAGSEKLTSSEITGLQKDSKGIWVVAPLGDFNMKADARGYLKENFKLKETKYTNKNVGIWHWEKNE